MIAQLIPSDGGPPITLHNPITVIGRSAKHSDLLLKHSSVSKMHCLLVKTDGLVYMRDLGSTNGTRVNGQRVIRGALMPNDKLTISGFSFRIYLGPDTPSSQCLPTNATELLPIVPEKPADKEEFFSPAGPVGSKSTRSGGVNGDLHQSDRSSVRTHDHDVDDSDLLPLG
jgi:hypothetical protein